MVVLQMSRAAFLPLIMHMRTPPSILTRYINILMARQRFGEALAEGLLACRPPLRAGAMTAQTPYEVYFSAFNLCVLGHQANDVALDHF